MQEQFDENLKEIETHQFITPKDQLGYAEEYIILNEDNDLLNYSLSNSLDDIEIAIFTRTGHNINLDKAKWKKNKNLSISVKHLMNKHKVSFSMTVYFCKKETRNIVINMRVGDNWFTTGYNDIEGIFYSWDFLDSFKELKKFLGKYNIDLDKIFD